MVVGECDHIVGAVYRVLCARHQWGVDLFSDASGSDLVAKRVDGPRRRSDPGQPLVDDAPGELGVFRQKTVAGVDGVRTAVAASLEHFVDIQIALRRRLATDPNRLIRHFGIRRVLVGVGVDRHGGKACVAGCADDTDRDLAAVGDEDLAERKVMHMCGPF